MNSEIPIDAIRRAVLTTNQSLEGRAAILLAELEVFFLSHDIDLQIKEGKRKLFIEKIGKFIDIEFTTFTHRYGAFLVFCRCVNMLEGQILEWKVSNKHNLLADWLELIGYVEKFKPFINEEKLSEFCYKTTGEKIKINTAERII